MSEDTNDNFQYILQLTKLLTVECRSTRQETDKIELLLKRVAKQSAISYERLSKDIPDENRTNFEILDTPSDINELIKENYNLLYQIEQQRYINNKVALLIRNIVEHFTSIKNLIPDQKMTREQDLENFIYENFESQSIILESSIKTLKQKKEISSANLNHIISTLRKTCQEIDWSLIPKDLKEYKQLIEQIYKLDSTYNIKLLPDAK